MTLQQLIYFKEVARVKHFTRAAENLYVAQSSLSHAIQELENEIGAPLFLRRNGKKVEITNYGMELLPYVDRALAEVEAGKQRLSEMISPERGIVNITYTFINGCNIMREIEDAFYADGAHPDIEIRSIVNHSGLSFLEDRLTLCDADLAISCTHFQPSRHVKAKRLCDQHLYVAVPPDSRYANCSGLSLHDIKDEPVIMYSGAYNLYGKVVQMFDYEGLTPKYLNGYTDWSTQLFDVARGKGVAILPKVDMSPAIVTYVPLIHPLSSRDVYLLWPTEHQLSAAASAVKDFVLDFYENKNK